MRLASRGRQDDERQTCKRPVRFCRPPLPSSLFLLPTALCLLPTAFLLLRPRLSGGQVELVAGAGDEHRLGDGGRAGGRAADDAALLVQLPHAAEDQGVPDLAGDAELVAAGEEDNGAVGQLADVLLVVGVLAGADVEQLDGLD